MIPDIIKVGFPDYATLTHATVSLADMGEKSIATQIKIDAAVAPDFSHDWELRFQGERYIMPLRKPQGSKDNATLNATIDLTFQHWAIYQLKRWMFFSLPDVETGSPSPDKWVVPLQLNLRDFCAVFARVLEYWYGDTITLDLNPAWKFKAEPSTVDISYSFVWDVLIKLYEIYAVRWSIEPIGDADHYVIRIGYPAVEVEHIFEYGFEGGLLKVERQVQSEEIRNMLLGRGGDKNLPLRYFKDKDPGNPKFSPDPDWVQELANIYFDRLRGATFRSYVQGWKAAHISEYPGYTAVGEDNAYAPWAYRKGYTDAKFDPVEYVKDDESILLYGPLLGALDDNDDFYPTIQGTGLDIAVDVEQILSDDVQQSSDATSVISDVKGGSLTQVIWHGTTASFVIPCGDFIVPPDSVGVLVTASTGASAYWWDWVKHDEKMFREQFAPNDFEILSTDIDVFDSAGNKLSSSVGIPPGAYTCRVRYEVINKMGQHVDLVTTISCNGLKLTTSASSKQWSNTFDIWVKNIWDSAPLPSESDAAYARRVWEPVLGDREGSEAKVLFTTGNLAVSDDYEFTIVEYPVPDSSKSYTSPDGVTHQSHWRIRLAKSDADLESTGVYVPSTKRQGAPGDRFVFIGTEMTHIPYVVDAERRLDDWKTDNLADFKDIRPTWVVTTDRVRLNNEGRPDALIGQLRIGNSIRLADSRFIQPVGDKAYETLYLQSLTITYREPSSDDAALNPDVEIVLGNDYAVSANPVSTMQGDISAIQQQLGSISNVEQIVRAVGDSLYLRKDGISDRSLSPTQFFSLLTSGDFRNGVVGGAGWGFFKDEDGNWVLETDRINVRSDLQVNNLVINQVSARGGMQIDTAASITITKVIETQLEYVCYFDQKNGSVANLFKVGDVAMSMVYDENWDTDANLVKAYRRRVTAVAPDSISLTKERDGDLRPSWWIDNGVNGSGVPSVGDVVVHFGNYNEKARQYVKVRDVVGGGYERFIDGLDSVNASGVEYFFVGRQAGMYGDRPRWFVGDTNGYIEWVNGHLDIKGRISVLSTIGGKPVGDYVSDAAKAEADKAKAELEASIKALQEQVDGAIESFSGFGAPSLTNFPAVEWTTDAERKAHDRDIYTDRTPYVDDATTPTSGHSWKWYYNTPTDYGWTKIADSDAVKALQMAQMSVRDSDVYFISHTSATSAPPLPVIGINGEITDAKGWSTSAPAWQQDKYIWQTTYTVKGDGSVSFTDPTCISGRNGKGIASITEQYYLSTSRDNPVGSSVGWTDRDHREQWTVGKYWWTRSKITYTDGTSEYIGEVCVTGADGVDGTSVLARYSSDLANWHPTMLATDIYMQTSSDGGKTWSPAVRMTGSDYTENLMLNTEKQIGGIYTDDGDHWKQWPDHKVRMEQGQTYTISGRTNAEAFTNVHTASIGLSRCALWICSNPQSPQGEVNQVVSGTDMATDGSKGYTFTWDFPTGEYYLRTNFYSAGTWWVEKVKVEKGRNPSPVWTPNSSEMIGKDGQWTKNQWAKNNSSTTAPTAGWQDTPMKASAGEYVWIRSGIVVPPATEPTKYGEAVRLTGDKGADGSDVYRLDLDNEMGAVAFDADGTMTGTYPTSTARVYKGATQVTSGVNFSIAQKSGITTANITSAGAITMSGLTADRAEITVQAVVDGITLTAIMTVYKVKAGKDGESVAIDKSKSSVTYQASANFTTPPTGQWLTAVPSVPNGHYLWTRTIVTYTDGTSTTAYSVARQGVNGTDGTNGINGDSYTNNILRNTDFREGGRHWWFMRNGVTAVDTSRVFQGRYSVKSTQSGASSTKPCGWIAGNDNEFIPAKKGDAITLSCWVCCDNPSAIDGDVVAEIYWRDAAKQRIATSVYNHASFMPSGPGTWTLRSLTSDVAPEGTAYAELRCQLMQNGTVWFNGIKAEYGANTAPVWTPFAEGTALDGQSVTYAKSSTASQPSDSAFTATSIGQLGLAPGEYMWSKTEARYSDGTVTKSYTVARVGTDGTRGLPGAPGKDGKTTYVHFAYASGITGSLPHPAAVHGFKTTAFEGAKYLGVCTDYNEADPTANVETAYEWSDYKGKAAVVYEIIPSVDVIKRSMTGELSDSSVSCSVYKVTGDTERVPTAEKTLKYTRLPDGATGTLAHDGGNSAAIAVLADTEAVVFELYDGSVLLDRERVLVLSDASDIEIGGTNLLRNSAATIERTYTDYGDHYFVLPDRTIHMEQGKIYTISAQTNAEFIDPSKHSNVNGGVLGDWVSLWIVSPSPQPTDGSAVNILVTGTDMASDGSKGHTFKWENPTGDYVLRVNFYAPGTWWVKKIMIERGNVASAWSPSPEDMDYLTRALRESITMDGGLLLATLIKLGYTDPGGLYKVMAGVNGSYTSPSDIAFWSGGEMVDKLPPQSVASVQAASELAAQAEGATYVMRMNGTGYMADGVLRFEKNHIGVGDSVILDNSGLHLMDGDSERLRIANTPIDEKFLNAQLGKTEISAGPFSGRLAFVRRYSPHDNGTFYPRSGMTVELWSGTLTKDSFVSLSVSYFDNLVRVGSDVVNPSWSARPYIEVTRGNKYTHFKSSSSTAASFTVPEDDTYYIFLRIDQDTYTGGSPSDNNSIDVEYSSIKLAGYSSPPTSVGLTLGNNGFAGIFDKIALIANPDGITMMAGNYGLRLAPARGIQYNTTGLDTGWKNLV